MLLGTNDLRDRHPHSLAGNRWAGGRRGGLVPPYMLLLLLSLGGCGQRDEIAKYTTLKPEIVDPTLQARPASASATSSEQQTLGLIVSVGDVGWFFKLTGDVKGVEPQHEAFLQFATSIKFSAGGEPKPTWTLPEGWKELPGREMRFATIQIAADGKPLELSVIPLPKSGADDQKYVLDNVNRWRQQLNLKPVAAGELSSTTKTLSIDGREATLVSLVGTGSGGMGGAPFAPFAGGVLPPDHPPIGGNQPTK
jgi:hypothetical protein